MIKHKTTLMAFLMAAFLAQPLQTHADASFTSKIVSSLNDIPTFIKVGGAFATVALAAAAYRYYIAKYGPTQANAGQANGANPTFFTAPSTVTSPTTTFSKSEPKQAVAETPYVSPYQAGFDEWISVGCPS